MRVFKRFVAVVLMITALFSAQVVSAAEPLPTNINVEDERLGG